MARVPMIFAVSVDGSPNGDRCPARSAPSGPQVVQVLPAAEAIAVFSPRQEHLVQEGCLMAEPGVEIVWGSVTRAWRKSGHTELWLQFRPRGSKNVLGSVYDSVEVANQVVEDAGWGDDVHTSGISESDAGPVVFMRRAGHEPGLRAWLEAFAHHLESDGKAGRVTAAPQAFFPDWLSGAVELPRQLTAFVSYRTKDLTHLGEHERRAGWHVPADVTEKVADAGAAWGRFPGADVYLSRDIHQIRTKNPDVGRPLADGITKSGMAGVTYLSSESRRKTSMYLFSQGQACYQVMDDTVSMQDRLQQVNSAMVAFPEDTDLAFVQYSHVHTITWMDLAVGRPKLPYVSEGQIRENRHLHSQYTPDAHGLQLLTDAHLEHANDLSDWVILPLGAGRHLVGAKLMRPWYANIDPDPQTLVEARADFGKMILTPETIADNPPPWH
jgi:hypothetical protein